jgi:hypothetical protein
VDALVFVVLGMIVGFCMADALHRFARRAPRDVALSMSGEHPYIVLPHDATREDVDAAHARLAASARATPANDMATDERGPLDVQRGNPRMMGN